MSPHRVVRTERSGAHCAAQSGIWVAALSKRQYCWVYFRWTVLLVVVVVVSWESISVIPGVGEEEEMMLERGGEWDERDVHMNQYWSVSLSLALA